MGALGVFRRYGVYGSLRLMCDFAVSRVVFPGARLVRRPFYVRSDGRIELGKRFTSGPGLRIDAFGAESIVRIGSDVQVNDNVHIAAIKSVVIGDRVLIASGVFISDHGHGEYAGENPSLPTTPPAERQLYATPVEIGDDSWLGEHVCVLRGVRIGKGAVVGAGSVVVKSIPDFTIAVGVPARVVKVFDFEKSLWVSV